MNASRPIKKPGRVCAEPLSLNSSHGSPLASPSAGRPDRHASGKSPAPPARDALDVEIGHLRVSAFDERLVFLRKFREDHARFNIASKPPRIEAVLQ